jgi:hypothetical protein
MALRDSFSRPLSLVPLLDTEDTYERMRCEMILVVPLIAGWVPVCSRVLVQRLW